jgi:phosphoribosyl 1,2-cyclic phosphodiesterase
VLVRFWGTRGSLPAPLDAQRVTSKIRAALQAARSEQLTDDARIDAFIGRLPFAVSGTFGGNSSCVEIETGGKEHLLFDAGSGLRVFGNTMLAKYGPSQPQTYNLFMSHLHWDHIMGFPFFTPAYIPGNRLRIYGCHENIREALARQHGPPSFPVPFDVLGAAIEFIHLEPGRTYDAPGGGTIATLKQRHGGDSFGYRYERDGKAVVYSTDSEHKLEVPDETVPFVEFFDRADLVIFDAMYSLGDAASLKEDWGHSSNVVGVDLAQRAHAKHLVLFHHEPANDDAMIERILAETRRYEEISREDHALQITAAYDGLEITV